MARGREFELKFAIDPADVEQVISHRLVRPGLRDRRLSSLSSTYFDTPDRVLQRHRFGLRIRRSGHEVTHTLKQTGTSLVDRGEWERTGGGPRPDIAWLHGTPAAPLLRIDASRRGLAPCFDVDVARTTMVLRHRKASIEVALDQGAISAEGTSLPISEVELEMKRGRPGAVLDLARRLARDLPLTLSLATKSERGYGLADLTWGRPSQTIEPAMTEKMSIAAAFESIVQCCLHAFLKNAALIGGGESGEAVHKARIALRHLRAAEAFFRPVLRRRRAKRLHGEVKWLSDKFGAARDADVFQAMFDERASHQDVPGAPALARIMREHRGSAHERLDAALASRRARLLFIDLHVFASDGVRRKARRARFRPYARDALRRHRRKLARRAVGLAQQSSQGMHEVRKQAKMLRYDLALVARLPRLGKVQKLKQHLKVLQESLGVLNDEAAMRHHLRHTVLARRAGPPRTGEERRAIFAAAQMAAASGSHEAQLRQAAKASRNL